MKRLKAFLSKKWVQHLAFWVLSFAIFWRLFGYLDFWNLETDLIYTFLFHLSIWYVVYLNLEVFLPRFFQRGQYLGYAISLIFTLSSGVLLNLFTFNELSDWLFPGYYFISYHTWWDLTQILFVYLAATTLLKLSRSWFRLREQERRLEELERQNLTAELESLRVQLHPHFLFNHLNTLYALALEEDPRTADYVLKLSDHLRHLTYGNDSESVPLEEEVQWLRNYIELQEVKGERNIELNIRGSLEGKELPPLLMLPLLENAFKHGDLSTEPLVIRLQASGDTIHFYLRNRIRRSKAPSTGGLGLKNVRRRLELIFPDRHELTARKENGHYAIEMKIPAA